MGATGEGAIRNTMAKAAKAKANKPRRGAGGASKSGSTRKGAGVGRVLARGAAKRSASGKRAASAGKSADAQRVRRVPATEARRVRTAKGRRPWFFANPEVDQLLAMLMAVATELAATRERLDTVERIAASRNLFSSGDIDAFRPDQPTEEWREEWRSRFLDRVMRILAEELDDIAYDEADKEYEKIIAGIAVK